MKQTLEHIRSELRDLYPPEEVEQFIAILFRQVCHYSRADIIIHKNSKLSESLALEIRRFTQRLKAYEPIQYVLGSAPFLDYEFHVRPGVLIPRPETEELIELIGRENPKAGLQVLDIGTGSGCIAVSLALRLPEAKVTAFDISDDALAIARENATLNNARVNFRKTDILNYDPTPEKALFDIIVSNPPYVCESEKEEMTDNVLKYEPHLALFVPDTDPLLFYRQIARHALTLLRPEGKLYYEINARFGRETKEMLEQLGYRDVVIIQDIHRKERMIRAIRP
ncbi:MAG: peptide chain release factor N(5)-glutamine methyltransferase [Bacteroidales bacterium]